jgi:uncharacterized protein
MFMDSQNDFLSTIPADCLVQIFKRHPILLAYLYGSTASGHTSPFSDVDIALLVPDSVLPTQYLQLELTIEDEIVQTCGIVQPDVRIINKAPLVFKGQVVTNGILLYARDENKRIAFETETRLTYFDFQPTIKTIREAFFKDLLKHGLSND